MSVVASHPNQTPGPVVMSTFNNNNNSNSNNSQQPYPVAADDVSVRSPSVISYASNYSSDSAYSSSTAPTIYSAPSPVSPTSPRPAYRLFKHAPVPPTPREPAIQRLPPRVYECILDHLQALHESPQQSGCTTCFQRDLHALALTNRTWDRAVRKRLWVFFLLVTILDCAEG